MTLPGIVVDADVRFVDELDQLGGDGAIGDQTAVGFQTDGDALFGGFVAQRANAGQECLALLVERTVRRGIVSAGAGGDIGNAQLVGDIERLAEFLDAGVGGQVGVTGEADRGLAVLLQQVLDVRELFRGGVAANMLGPARNRGELDAGVSGRGRASEAFLERVRVIAIGAKRQPIGHGLPSSRCVALLGCDEPSLILRSNQVTARIELHVFDEESIFPRECHPCERRVVHVERLE